MDVIKKPIDEASPQEIRNYAMVSLGLDVTGSENRNQIIGLMKKAGVEPEFIVIHAQAKEVDRSQGQSGGVKVINGVKHLAIIIASLPGVGGDRAIPLRVNGSNFIVPRGKACWVPEKFVESLQNAVGLEYEPTEDGGLSEGRVVSSYPFNRVPDVPEAAKVVA